MTKEELYAHPGWQWCTFEGAELHTLLLGLRSTFREKLEWLEEAETLTLSFRAQREKRAAEEARSEVGDSAIRDRADRITISINR